MKGDFISSQGGAQPYLFPRKARPRVESISVGHTLLTAMASADPSETLTCPNCQNSSADTDTCEHNFCWVCIDCMLDKQRGVRTQHQCRAEERRGQQVGSHDSGVQQVGSHDGSGGITCTYCVHSPVPAVRSCVMCEASLCDTHLSVHSRSPEHPLIEPTTALRNRKCAVHKKILEYYCSADRACVCVSCILFGDHRGHRVETLNVVSERKKKRLKNDLKKLNSRSEETAKKIQTLQGQRRDGQERASEVSGRVSAIFRDIRRRLDAMENTVLSHISQQDEQLALSLSTLVQQLELHRNELFRRAGYLEELWNKVDPLLVIQEQESEREDFCDLEEGAADTHQIYHLDQGLMAVTLHTGLQDIMVAARKGLDLQGAGDILLDVDTAGNDIHISSDLRGASWSHVQQNYPEKPGRFQYDQVLSTRSFSSGRHFWEVETSESGVWFVGMCYPSIDRRGRQSWIGDNNKSWCLRRYDNVQYTVIHDSKWLQLPHNVSCPHLGIYLDYEAGQLTFYELRDPIRLLHTFTTTFTQPLHLAFSVYKAWVRVQD
ncbi:E3 ubiquitin/ISG15 ligase TRIM25-like [Hyla sarda]|uniref:E3 ubiquitin/ISG15 ligase TRIM25-like n=1 Tax=Hyla sarda TaxID=327740 RepID=UPI0024C270B8|nr:E3 ubiquitin/ISG15 ligase TRIM25-like [Hyla sarda]